MSICSASASLRALTEGRSWKPTMTALENNLFNEIEKMEKSELNSREYSEYNDQFPLFLIIALCLIVCDFMILDRKNKWLRNFRLFGNQK